MKNTAFQALGGAGLFGLSVYVGARLARVASIPLLYHAIVFGLFFGIYRAMPGGFEANFNTPDKKKKMGTSDIAYYTMVVHSTVGFGDVYPLSYWGKLAVAAHIFMVMLATASLVPMGSSS